MTTENVTYENETYHFAIGHGCGGCEYSMKWHRGCIPLDKKVPVAVALKNSTIGKWIKKDNLPKASSKPIAK